MPLPRCDLHVHTKYLGCANGTMEVPAIAARCAALGVECLGITDHLNTLDRLPGHRRIREDLATLNAGLPVYFGVELNFLNCDGAFAFSEEVKAEMGFQFAIGGIHETYTPEFEPRKVVEIQHRHHLRTCEDPLVDVLVHPYWFSKGEFDRRGWPWFNPMEFVPERYARELGQAAKASGTAVEINACANLVNPMVGEEYLKRYRDYLAAVAAEGATFATGSDAHDIAQLSPIRTAWAIAEEIGLRAEQVWRPDGEPFAGRRRPGEG